MKLNAFVAAQVWLGILTGATNAAEEATTFTPARPPAIPLAVKSPYMNTWLEVGSNGGSGGYLAGNWPRFWAGPQPGPVDGPSGAVTAWTGLIKVDDKAYTWMGAPSVNGISPPTVTQNSFEYTSTRSTFMMNVAGEVGLNVSFMNPITPFDLKRQSVIGTYLSVTAWSIDGRTHSVQLYTDTSGEWVNPTHNQEPIEWKYSVQNEIASHVSYQQKQSEFNADYPDDAAHWGSWYWNTAASPFMTYQSGPDVTVRQNFLSNGKLPNSQDTTYRPISQSWPVFAFSNDLGFVGETKVTTLYTIVHAQQNAILFDGANGLTSIPSLWTSYFGSDLDLVEFFHKDFNTNTGSLDHQIAIDSLAAGGSDYVTITALSARQAFAGTQLCGTPSKPYLFLKEISSDGNVQTVDVVFPAMPIFLYLNPALVKYLLEPLYENQESGKFPQRYSIHDVGANYPRATGHPDGGGEPMPLEECGNMIILTLAYAQRTSDISYLTKHYSILKQWTSYLISEALIPANQLSTDDFQGQLANQTNLALKGIIGIAAMGRIAHLTGNNADAANYVKIASSYIGQWQQMAVVKDGSGKGIHTNLQYGDGASHGLLYNLYADRLLGLNLVPQSVYDMQSAFYTTVAQQYGLPLDTRNTNTKSDWQMWTAAISSPSTKQMFISKLANFVRHTSSSRAFTDLYNTQTGDGSGFIARPVIGGHFALLALNGAPKSTGTAAGPKLVVQDRSGVKAKEFRA